MQLGLAWLRPAARRPGGGFNRGTLTAGLLVKDFQSLSELAIEA